MEYYFKALDIQLQALGNEHPDTGHAYCNIGNVYLKQLNLTEALDYYNKGL